VQYNRYHISKRNGGYREINAPDAELKQHSLRLLGRLENELKRLNWWRGSGSAIYSYSPNKSCKMLVDDICSFTSNDAYDIYYLDVVNFFGVITKEHVNKSILMLNRQGCLLDQAFWDQVWDAIKIGTIGIAQGNPLSPTISNLVGWACLDVPFLNKLVPFCDFPIGYYRYSDNIFIVCKREGSYSRQEFLSRLADFLVHSLTHDFLFTSKLRSHTQLNIVLGIRLGQRAQLPNKNWLRSVFYRYKMNRMEMLDHKDMVKKYGRLGDEQLKQVVYGLASYARGIDPKMSKYIDECLVEEVANGV
jgi:hypothetical protein